MSFAVLAIPLTIWFIYVSIIAKQPTAIVSFSIFGFALFALYTTSSVYHALSISERATKVLKRIDHMMIFVLIAGTYTPICLGPLFGVWGISLLCVVWGMALAGVFLKIFWIGAPRWLSTGIYVCMGWSVVVAFYPLIKSVPPLGVVLLASGGMLYTVGAVIYACKWPKTKFKYFGFHEIFHLFVMAGTIMHVIFMAVYVLPHNALISLPTSSISDSIFNQSIKMNMLAMLP